MTPPEPRRTAPSQPYRRLARWTPEGWRPVAIGSVGPGRVFVLAHGWTPGLRDAMEQAGFLTIWDAGAEGANGRRYDAFYLEVARSLQARIPAATVLGYTWADESATRPEFFDAGLSQRRTVTAGRRLAVALQQVLADPEGTALHMLGHSHGSKVAVVASAYLDTPPTQVTLFDSPDRAVFTLGQVQNDLPAFLRLLSLHPDGDRTVIDNYVSQLGIRYAGFVGAATVLDVTLDPDAYPLEEGLHPHSYGWAWYCRTIRDPGIPVGFNWSPMTEDPVPFPGIGQRQDRAAGDPFALEPRETPRAGRSPRPDWGPPRTVKRDGTVLATPDRTRESMIVWRRRGGAVVSTPFRWLRGQPGDRVEIRVGKTQVWSSAYGWPGSENGHAVIPLVALPPGPHRLSVRLTAADDAAVLFGPDSERLSFALPATAEMRGWIRRGSISVALSVAAFVLRPRLRSRSNPD